VTMDDRLRSVYRELQTAGSEACPGDDDLAALVLGELPPERRDAVADHAVACRRCAKGAAILLETRRETAALAGSGPAPERRRWIAIAAAAAAIAVIALLIGRPADRGPSVERGRGDRTAGFVPADGAELTEAPTRFAWPAVERAEAYRLRIYRDSGEPAWASAAIAAPSVDLPPETRAHLAKGGSYYWVVEVEGSSGTSRLGPLSFRVAPGR
jgi:anti-sigma factor RsiW